MSAVTTRDHQGPHSLVAARDPRYSFETLQTGLYEYSLMKRYSRIFSNKKKYIRLLSHKWHTAHVCLQSKVQVLRNTAHRLSTQASYTIGSGTTLQENQPAIQIAAKHSIFSRMVPYMSWIFLVLVGIDPGVSRLGGEIVSHYTTDTRHLIWCDKCTGSTVNKTLYKLPNTIGLWTTLVMRRSTWLWFKKDVWPDALKEKL